MFLILSLSLNNVTVVSENKKKCALSKNINI